LPKAIKNHPNGEILPNLVTLNLLHNRRKISDSEWILKNLLSFSR
jgi:hypothetical protein